MPDATLASRLRLAAWLIAAGLAVQATTLIWTTPSAFLAFLLVGGSAVAAGIGVYLLALLRR